MLVLNFWKAPRVNGDDDDEEEEDRGLKDPFFDLIEFRFNGFETKGFDDDYDDDEEEEHKQNIYQFRSGWNQKFPITPWLSASSSFKYWILNTWMLKMGDLES